MSNCSKCNTVAAVATQVPETTTPFSTNLRKGAIAASEPSAILVQCEELTKQHFTLGGILHSEFPSVQFTHGYT